MFNLNLVVLPLVQLFTY